MTILAIFSHGLKFARRHPVQGLAVVLASVSFLCAILLFIDWQHDNSRLRQLALKITQDKHGRAEKIIAINDWVYHDQGFAPNHHYFIVSALGATPLQVMHHGGPCFDKSRLEMAMLYTLNIPAGLVMLRACPHCAFVHTVVEAQLDDGRRMVADPTWNMVYPGRHGGYLGVRQLHDTKFAGFDVMRAQSSRPGDAKIQSILRSNYNFDYAVRMNWNKDAITRSIAGFLSSVGYDPDTMMRPRFLEAPKLLLSMASAMLAAGVLFLLLSYQILRRVRDRAVRR